jgi:hypothetical protein
MIFIDSNIPMYLVGSPHPHKSDSRRLLERFVAEKAALVTDAEVFQEILHRYAAINRRDAISPAFEALLAIADTVFPIEQADVENARGLITAKKKLSARDAIHVAIMERYQVKRIMSFDAAFDSVSNITRIHE